MTISEMQHKLAIWSKEDPDRKFDRILRTITDRLWLREAARITLSSKGARTSGVDGINKAEMVKDLHQHLEQIRSEILGGSKMPE